MNGLRLRIRAAALAALAAAAASTAVPIASACGPEPEVLLRAAVQQRLATMGEDDLRALVARLDREARAAQARAAERARTVAQRPRRVATR